MRYSIEKVTKASRSDGESGILPYSHSAERDGDACQRRSPLTDSCEFYYRTSPGLPPGNSVYLYIIHPSPRPAHLETTTLRRPDH